MSARWWVRCEVSCEVSCDGYVVRDEGHVRVEESLRGELRDESCETCEVR